jgi:hypothetical protein
MKKSVYILLAIIAFSIVARAQSSAVGLKVKLFAAPIAGRKPTARRLNTATRKIY